jgi:hypothetical protein
MKNYIFWYVTPFSLALLSTFRSKLLSSGCTPNMAAVDFFEVCCLYQTVRRHVTEDSIWRKSSLTSLSLVFYPLQNQRCTYVACFPNSFFSVFSTSFIADTNGLYCYSNAKSTPYVCGLFSKFFLFHIFYFLHCRHEWIVLLQ